MRLRTIPLLVIVVAVVAVLGAWTDRLKVQTDAPPVVADPPAAVPAILELIADMHPRLALALANALGEADSSTLRATAHHLVGALEWRYWRPCDELL